MRKTAKTIVLLTMIFVMAISVGMMAMGCEIGGGGDGSSSSKTIYYQYNDNVKNPNDWICFEGDKWSDSENTGGRLEKSGNKFRAYLTIFGEEDVMFYGTVSNGVLKWTLGESFGMTIYYKYYSDDCTVSDKDSRGIPETGDGTDDGGQQPSEDNRTKYTVTFNSMGGSSVASVEVREGDRLTAPTQPTKSMSVFNGWYKDIACISVFDFETERITSNITLYAKWKQEEVRITSCEGATIDENNVISMVVSHDTNRVDMSGKIVINSNDAYWKLYYDQLGSQEIPTKLATGKDSTLSEGLNEFYIVVTSADQTQSKLYKLQIYKKYEVTIRVFGLNTVTPMGTRSAVTGDIMPTPNYTIPGYTITGWYCSEARLGEKIPLDSPRVINVYARYTPNEYTVTYDANNGTMSERSVKVTYGKETQFAVPTRVGYTFMGWYRNDDQVTGQNAKGTWNYADDGTLTAVWRANRYSVKTEANIAEAGTAKVLSDVEEVNVYFDLNGVTTTNGEVAMQTITKTQGLVYPTTPTANGKIFGGWFTDEDCTDYFDFSSNLGCDTTLYAKWYNISSGGTIVEPGQSNASYSVSGSTKYLYWLATNSCDYSVYYKNSNSSSNYAIYLKVYDVTDSTTVKNEFKISNTSYSAYTFSGTAGHVYRIDYYAYYYNTTLYSYVTQAEATPEGGKVDSANVAIGMYGDRITLQATTNDGYTFVGWYDGDTKIADTSTATITMPASNKTYTAKWTSYTITTGTNMSGAGTYTIKNQEKVTVGKSVTLTATTNDGYTWLGWYDGDTKLTGELSYTFTMTANNKTYTAKWSDCPVTLTKNIEEAGSVSGVEGATAVGKSATITATTNNGYTWVGWYDGDTKLTDERSYTFTMTADSKTYTAKWSKVTLDRNNTSAGSISSLDSTYKVGDSVTITATTNVGYTWVGWFDGETKLTDELSYTFTMTADSKTYTAKWSKVTLDKNITSAGSISSLDSTYKVGDSVTITATTNVGYTWAGWYDGDTKLTDELSYTFTMTADSKTYIAKWQVNEEMSNFDFESTSTTCNITGVKDKTIAQVVIPQYVTNIGDNAFEGCYRLIEVYNKSTLSIVAGNSSNGYVGYYAKNVYTEEGGSKLSTDANGYVIYTDGTDKMLVKYTGTDTALTLPSEITALNQYAFYECSSLTSVTIGNGVTSIGDKAFYECSSLTSITIPDSVTSIGGSAFYGCYSLIEVYNMSSLDIVAGSEDNGYVAYYAKNVYGEEGGSKLSTDANGYVIYTDGTDKILVKYTGSDTDLTLPSEITAINQGAFYGCSSLTSITIPDSVTSIGTEAFYECSSLTSITIPDSVTSIGIGAFSGCYSLKSISIPFVGATKDGSSSNTHFGYIFGASNYNYNSSYVPRRLKTVTITGGTSIGTEAFYECSSLTSITIPDSVTSIGIGAFSGCSSLTEMTIPFVGAEAGKTSSDTYQYPFGYIFGTTSYTGGVATSQRYYGYSTSSLTSTTYYIPSSLKSVTVTGGNILEGAFYYCSSLTSIIISDSVTGIGKYAFYYCSSLTSITIGNGVTGIGSYAFENCSSLTRVDITDIAEWCGIYFFSEYANPLYYAHNLYLNGELVTNLVIPDGVKIIGEYQFYNCSSLTSITIPDSVTSIRWHAFDGCYRLIEVYNKSSLGIVAGSDDWGYVGYYAKNVYTQEGGSKLSTDANGYVIYTDGTDKILVKYTGNDTDLTLPSGITKIYKNAFNNCTSLTSITIPDSVTSIGEHAFSYCSSLTSLTIGNGVTSIGTFAFAYCYSLTSINFQGTQAQWNAISKGSNWHTNYGGLMIYFTDDTI